MPRKRPNYSVAFISQAEGTAIEARRKRIAALAAARSAAPSEWQSKKSEYTRESILRAVINVLAEEGYSRLTMTQVANRAGLTKGALQHYFSSKAEAIEATLALIFEDQLALQRESRAGRWSPPTSSCTTGASRRSGNMSRSPPTWRSSRSPWPPARTPTCAGW